MSTSIRITTISFYNCIILQHHVYMHGRCIVVALLIARPGGKNCNLGIICWYHVVYGSHSLCCTNGICTISAFRYVLRRWGIIAASILDTGAGHSVGGLLIYQSEHAGNQPAIWQVSLSECRFCQNDCQTAGETVEKLLNQQAAQASPWGSQPASRAGHPGAAP